MHLRASFALLALFVCACSQSPQTPAPSAAARRGAPVRTADAGRRDVPLEVRAIGNVEAFSTVAVKSRVAGPLVRVHVRDGQTVRKGQLLFEIDSLPFEQQVRQAEANLSRDRAVEKQTEASIARSRAQEKQARAQAERYATLLKEGITSREQSEQFRVAAEAAEAALNAEISSLESARASIRANEVRLSQARVELSYTKLTAPISGRIGALALKEGNLIKENDTIALANILQVAPVWVAFSVPERSLAEMRQQMRGRKLEVLAVPEDSQTAPASGLLEFIDNSVDTSTGTIRVKAIFANTATGLWPGQFVNVTMKLRTEHDVVVVPAQAVQNRQEGSYVWVVRANRTAELRPVQIARMHGDLAVVAAGVQAGETVIVEGQLRVTPNAPVEATKKVAAAAPSAR